MITIILALCIPVTAFVTGFFVLKSVQIGLKWQIETKQGETPSPIAKSPIKPITEAKKEEKQKEETASIFREWIYGEQESR